MRQALRWLVKVWRAWLVLQARTWEPSRRASGLTFLPACEEMRRVLEATPAWRDAQTRLADTQPVATWQAYDLHYFRYACRPGPDGRSDKVVFVVRGSDRSLVSAVIVGADGPRDVVGTPDLLGTA